MADRIDLSSLNFSREVLRIVPTDVAYQELVLPLRFHGDTLVVAVGDPFDADTLDRLRFILNREIEAVGVPATHLRYAIWRFYRA